MVITLICHNCSVIKFTYIPSSPSFLEHSKAGISLDKHPRQIARNYAGNYYTYSNVKYIARQMLISLCKPNFSSQNKFFRSDTSCFGSNNGWNLRTKLVVIGE